ncbi:H-type small acid-soluble spore protein [Bacillus shivajii]|uniref:H-type small acid-soluble spore protein n=1 Tax=Bacillus shivajii TaxID=1983719 RepID=UPI001CFB6F79|nr:H-type small acid-soluble spore protein [Bacillus shivajii]UCZ53167.1 H-type small acid-soluble spore protein [Bacillus shivajii]
MNKDRVMEILDSPDMIEVMYKGTPIFIEQVDESIEQARVYPLDDPTKHMDVEVESLQEH